MARVAKLIWRLDYNPSYDLMDRRGTALKILQDVPKGFWSSVGEGTNPINSFAAEFSAEGTYRNFSLEATSLNGSVEWPGGVDIQDLLKTEEFRTVDRIISTLLKTFNIDRLRRAGIRLICVEKITPLPEYSLKINENVMKDDLLNNLKSVLGSITDIAFLLDGTTADEVNYRAQFGPTATKSLDRLLQKVIPPDEMKTFLTYPIMADIDLYEVRISFAEHSFFRWSRTKVEKVAEFMLHYRKYVDGRGV